MSSSECSPMIRIVAKLRCVPAAVLVAVLAGCATPEKVARLVLTPPNVQRTARSSQWADHWLRALCGGTNRFKSIDIPVVGPPQANLKALELSPGDYQLDFTSAVENDGHGGKVFSVKAIPR